MFKGRLLPPRNLLFARMEKILISKEWDRGYAFYAFKPQGYIDNFFERTSGMMGIGYDKHRRKWTAPVREESITFLKEAFGEDCLGWRGNTSGSRQPIQGGAKQTVNPKQRSFSGGDKRTVKEKAHSLSPVWRSAFHRTEEQLLVKRYSYQTVKSYLSHLYAFLAAHPKRMLADITSETVRSYIVKRTEAGNYSESTQNQMLNAIKFWLEQVEGREKAFVDLRPKKRNQLPKVLSVEEVRRLFDAVENLKHRCILKIIYGGGLRLSEVVNLRLSDIHSDRLQLFVNGGKGKKDRYTTLSAKFLEELRTYYKEYQPKHWLFEGQTGGQYSRRSVQAVLRKAVDKSGVNSLCTVHTLRHSYATHLLEAGTSLRHIQELLGHANSSTTEIYTHVSNAEKQRVISPLDRI